MAKPVGPSSSRDFRNHATTQAEEDAYDFLEHRKNVKFTSLIGSIAHLVKGALGGGILSGHVGFMNAGNVCLALCINLFFGLYMGYCLLLLIQSAQVLYRRTRIPVMSYADVGEASCMLFHNKKVQKCSKLFRYFIDAIISIDLFGSCCCYQIIIAKSIKQLVENVKETTFEPAYEGYPNLRMYLALAIPVIILICLIRHLKYLAPFSIAANFVILVSIGMTIYYAFLFNPSFEGMRITPTVLGFFTYVAFSVNSMTCSGIALPIENHMAQPLKFPIALLIVISIGMTIYYAFLFNPSFEGMMITPTVLGFFVYIGMSVFSMSCSGVVIPIENSMAQPLKFPIALLIGMILIVLGTASISFFGYAAFLDKCEAPITINFPMSLMPQILKGLIAVMIIITHGLNFWVPFNLCFYYIKKRYPPEKHVRWELIWRAIFVIIIALVAIIFPDINAIMGFIGCFCLSNMAFIWPNFINLLVIWQRPGFGRYKWRLFRAIIFMAIGFFIFICGSLVTFAELIHVFIKINVSD